jgi:hypothetical protein
MATATTLSGVAATNPWRSYVFTLRRYGSAAHTALISDHANLCS